MVLQKRDKCSQPLSHLSSLGCSANFIICTLLSDLVLTAYPALLNGHTHQCRFFLNLLFHYLVASQNNILIVSLGPISVNIVAVQYFPFFWMQHLLSWACHGQSKTDISALSTLCSFGSPFTTQPQESVKNQRKAEGRLWDSLCHIYSHAVDLPFNY